MEWVWQNVGDFLKIERCLPLDETDTAKLSADESMSLQKNHCKF